VRIAQNLDGSPPRVAPADPEPAEVARAVRVHPDVAAQTSAEEANDAVFVLPPSAWDAEHLRLLALALAGVAWCAWSDGLLDPERRRRARRNVRGTGKLETCRRITLLLIPNCVFIRGIRAGG